MVNHPAGDVIEQNSNEHIYKWGSRLRRGSLSAAKRLIACLLTNILRGFADIQGSSAWEDLHMHDLYRAKVSPSQLTIVCQL